MGLLPSTGLYRQFGFLAIGQDGYFGAFSGADTELAVVEGRGGGVHGRGAFG